MLGVLTASAGLLAALTAAASDTDEEQRTALASPQLLVDPSRVSARLFYHGETVRVLGSVPAVHEVAIVIRGNEAPVELKLKGKVGGVIWANVGDVTIDGAPSLYLVATTPGLRTLIEGLPGDEPSVGYRFLERQSRLSPVRSDEENHRIFQEFVKLKEKEELYAVSEGQVELTALPCGDLTCTAEFFIPPDVPEGSFEVQVLGFDRDGGRVLESAVLTVEKAGLAGTISMMATERGLLYGLLSVIVALLAGGFAGLVFGQRSKGGH